MKPLRFEALEPRILYSADAALLLAGGGGGADAGCEVRVLPAPVAAPAAAAAAAPRTASATPAGCDVADRPGQGAGRADAADPSAAADASRQRTPCPTSCGPADATDPTHPADHSGEQVHAERQRQADPADPSATVTPTQQTAREIVFIDSRVPDAQRFVDDLARQRADGREIEVVMLSAAQDGVAQIDAVLRGEHGLAALHIVSHGAAGEIEIGSTRLDAAALAADAPAVAAWGAALAADGDLLLYGCDVAAGASGRGFVQALGRLTGADIAASSDPTGAAARGGDWVLEQRTGPIEAASVAGAALQAGWQGVLATFTVTSTVDDGLSAGTVGTLRYAVTAANLNPGADSIAFNLGGAAGSYGEYTITLASALPNVTGAVDIDGSTQPGAIAGQPRVVLDGNGVAGNGLYLSNTADGSTVRGLVLRGFGSAGIYVQAASDDDTIAGNYIGSFNADGSEAGSAARNGGSGIESYGGNLRVGGSAAADRNLVAGNAGDAVYLGSGADGTLVAGNLIGLNAAGSAVFGATNGAHGVTVDGTASGVTIGGTAAGAGNVVSGFTSYGVWATSSGTLTLQGNRIGTDAAGQVDLGNAGWGVYADDSGSLVVGGSAAGAGNLVSGNDGGGIYLGNAGAATVQGNTVGLNAAGTAALANGGVGIDVQTAAASTIGGAGAAARNVVSGNAGHGIRIGTSPAGGHVVQGNYIGVGADGTTVLGNGGAGIYVAASGALIGGKTAAGQGNTIVGNAGAGIAVASGIGNLVYRNAIAGNGGLGVDLNADGVTANDYNDTDSGANYRNNTPVITSVVTRNGTTTILGSIDGPAAAEQIEIELFATPAADASGYGPGLRYLGSTTVATNAATGDATFALSVGGVAVGEWISALANAESGSNLGASEFSMAVAAVAAAGPRAPRGKAIWNVNDRSFQNYVDWGAGGFGGIGTDGLNFGDDISMISAAEAPTRDEIIFVGSGDASGKILAGVWNGSGWASTLALPVASPSATAAQYHAFDVAYDRVSGNALMVWDNGNSGTTGLSYATWNGSAWSAVATLSAPVGGEPVYMKLAASPSSHEMVLVVSTTAASVNQYAMVWNGSSFGNAVTGTNNDRQYFELNAIYEQRSGRAVAVFDSSASSSSGFQYRIWDGSAWSAGQAVAAPAGIGATSELYSTVLAADPNSNRIALAAKVAGEDVWMTVWDGNAWGDAVVATTSGTALTDAHPTMSLAFESRSGELLAAYGEASGPATAYRTWTAGGGWSAQQAGPNASAGAVPNITKLYADPYSNTVMMGLQDSAGHLRYAVWNGTTDSWGLPVEMDVTSQTYREDFTYVWYQNAPPAIADLAGDTLAYTEDQSATPIDQGAAASVVLGDPTGYAGATLVVSVTAGGWASEDELALQNQGSGAGQVGVAGSTVRVGGVVVGSVAGGTASGNLVVSFNGNASDAAAGAVLRAVTYRNTDGAAPTTVPRTVRFVLTDGGGRSSAGADTTVTLAATDDAPAVLLLLAPGAGSILVNGSFETNSSPAGPPSIGTGVTVAGWTAIGGEGFEVWNNYNSTLAPAPPNASDGVSRIELDVGSALNGIAQTVSTQAGRSYLLSFDFTNRSNATVPGSGVEVYWRGALVGTVDQAVVGWQTWRMTVLGSGGSDTLSFIETAATNDGIGSQIDNVLLQPVAAPAAVTVPENAANGTAVASARTLDPDGGADSAVYSLVDSAGGRFAIDPSSGAISVANGSLLDYESATSHNVTVRSTDSGGLYGDQAFTIGVTNVNEAPLAVADSALAVEAGGVANATAGSNPSGNVLANDTDPDAGDTRTLVGAAVGVVPSAHGNLSSLVGSYGTIVGTANGDFTYTVDNTNAAVQALRDATATLTDVFTYTVRDSGGLESSAQLTVTIRGADDAPVVVTGGGTLAVTENDAPAAVAPGLTLSDVDDTSLAGATVAISGNFASGQDVLAFSAQNGIVGSWNAATGVLTLSGSATVAQYQAALRSVTYANASDDPSAATRSVSFTVSDGSLSSDPASRNVAVATVNDVPVNSVPASLSGSEDTPLALSGLSISDPDAASSRLTTTLTVDRGTLAASGGGGAVTVGGSGTGSLTLAGTLADLNAFLAGASRPVFSAPADFNGTVQLSMVTSDGQNTGSGGALQAGAFDYRFVDGTPAGYDVDNIPSSGGITGVATDFDAAALALALTGSTDSFGVIYTGIVEVTNAGSYSFVVTADDAARLRVDGTLVADAFFGSASGSLALAAGRHRIELRLDNDTNSSGLAASYAGPDTGGSARPLLSAAAVGRLVSATAVGAINLAAVDDAPVATAGGGAAAYVENAAPVAVDPGITLADIDSPNLSGARITVTGNRARGQDVLAFAAQNGIAGSWNAATGTLTLSGSASVADYQAALRSVTYADTSETPSSATRSVSFTVNDGQLDSAAVTRQVTLTAVDDAPSGLVLLAPGAADLIVNGSFEVNNGAANTASSGAGVTVAGWTALDGDGFEVWKNFNNAGTPGPAAASDGASRLELDVGAGLNGISQQVNTLAGQTYLLGFDFSHRFGSAAGDSGVEVYWRGVRVMTVDTATVGWQAQRLLVTGSGGADTLVFVETAATNDTAGSQLDNVTLRAVAAPPIAVAENSANGSAVARAAALDADSGTAFTYALLDDAGGRFAIDPASGAITVADGTRLDFEAAASHAVTVRATDGGGSSIDRAFTIAVADVNEAPVALADGALAVEAGGIADGSAGSDPSGNLLANDSDPDAGDTLRLLGVAAGTATPVAGMPATVSGSYGTLSAAADGSFTYTVDNANAAVQALHDAGSTLVDTFSYTVADAGGLTRTATLAVTIRGADDAPVVVAGAGTLAYTENDAATPVAPALTLADVDDGLLAGATVAIGANYRAGQDVLAFAAGNGIGGSWNAATGVLTLSGSASVAQYQAALRSVTYANLSDDPDTAARSVSFSASDGSLTGAAASRLVSVAAVDDAPVLAGGGGAATAYAENAAPVAVDAGITVADADSANLSGARVAITTHFVAAQDTLAFADQNGITGSWNAASGVLTLAGSATAAQYEAALRSVTYSNGSDSPTLLARGVTFSVGDGTATSNPLQRSVAIGAIADAPAAIVLQGAAAANLVVNGSFESHNVAADSFAAGPGVRVAGWTASGGQGFEVWTGSYRDAAAPGPAAASDGSSRLELDVGGALNGISQSIATVAGQSYLLRFDLANRGGAVPVDHSGVDVYWRGSRIASVDQAVVGWQTWRFVVTGSGGADTLAFVETADSNDSAGSQLDDVRLVAVEPPTIAVAENAADGTPVARATALDPDGGADSAVYTLTDSAGGRFAIDAATGVIRVADGRRLDFEAAASHAVTVRATDGSGLFVDRVFAIAVADVDEPVDAQPDAAVAVEAGGIGNAVPGSAAAGNLLANDHDPDAGDTKTVVGVAAGSGGVSSGGVGSPLAGRHGTLVVAADGSYRYDVDDADAAVQALHDAAGTLTDTFTYTVQDGAGLASRAALTVTIRGADDAPLVVTTAGPALAYAENDAPAAVDAALTLTDLDDAVLVGARVAIGSNHVAGEDVLTFADQFGISGSWDAASGVLTLGGRATVAQYQAALRSVSYANGSDSPSTALRTISFSVDDGLLVSAAASRDVAVGAVDDAPGGIVVTPASAGAGPGVAENAVDGTLVATAAALDADRDDRFVYTLTDSAAGRFAIDAASGAIRVADGSRLDFEAAASHDIVVRATDGGGLWVERRLTVALSDVDEPVVARPDSAAAVEAGGVADGTPGVDPRGNLLANDSDPDAGDSRMVTGVVAGNGGGPASGGVGSALAGRYGTLVVAADGSFVYTLDNADAAVQALRDAADTLTDSFTYTVRDAAGLASSALLTVTIAGADDAPAVVANAGLGVAEGTAGNPITAAVLAARDVDSDAAALRYTLTGATAHGVLRLGGAALAAGDGFTQADIDAGRLGYDHDGSESTADGFDFVLDDGVGVGSDAVTGRFAITVAPVNAHAPRFVVDGDGDAADAFVRVAENATFVASVRAVDADLPAAALRYRIGGGADAAWFGIDERSGELRFARAPDFEAPADADGDGVYEVRVIASDGQLQAVRRWHVAVTDAAEAPSSADARLTTAEDTPLGFAAADFRFADPDAGDALAALRIEAIGGGGVFSLAPAAAAPDGQQPGDVGSGQPLYAGQRLAAADIARLRFTPAADAGGTAYATLSFRVEDRSGLQAARAGTLTIDVAAVDDAPRLLTAQLLLPAEAPFALTVGAAELAAADVDSDAGALRFIISGARAGHFEATGAAGLALSDFSQADLRAGRIRFVATPAAGDAVPPSFDVAVSDGVQTSAPVAATVRFAAAAPAPEPPPAPPPPPAPEPAPAPAPVPVAAAATAVLPTLVSMPPADATPARGSGQPEPADESSGRADPAGSAGSGGGSAGRPAVAVSALAGLPAIDAAGAGAPVLPGGPAAAAPRPAGDAPAGRVNRMVVDGAELLRQLRPNAELGQIDIAFGQRAADDAARALPPATDIALGSATRAVLRAGANVLADETARGPRDDGPVELGVVAQAMQATGAALTAGSVWWALRSGGLAASLLVVLPAWRHVDLLAVLPDDEDDAWDADDRNAAADGDAGGHDEEARDEQAVRRVFEPVTPVVPAAGAASARRPAA